MDKFRFSKEDIQKRGLKEWIKNYFFYYKWVTLIVVCSLILIISMWVSMANDMEYDAQVYLVCRNDQASALDVERIERKFANYAGDYDGKDGINIYFGYSAFPVVTEENTDTDNMDKVRDEAENIAVQEYLLASTHLAGQMDGDTIIYIFDETQYNEMCEQATYPIFVNLAERYPDLPIVDDCKLMVKDTIFAEEFGLVSDEWFFAVRELDYLRQADKKKVQEHYAYQMELFDAVVAASFPEA